MFSTGKALHRVSGGLDAVVTRSLQSQQPVGRKLADRARANSEFGDRDAAVRWLEKRYIATVTGLGAAAGGTAAMPGVGTGVGVGVNLAEVGAYIEATVAYVVALAHLYDMDLEDVDRLRMIFYGVTLGALLLERSKRQLDEPGFIWVARRLSGYRSKPFAASTRSWARIL